MIAAPWVEVSWTCLQSCPPIASPPGAGPRWIPDGARATVNPVSVPRSDRRVQVRVEASGWEPREVAVAVDRSRRVEVALQRVLR